jgi:hypothetical protein
LLNDHGTRSNFCSCHEGSDFDPNEIAASKFAVDCEVKQRAISQAPFPVEEETDCPYLALFQWLLDTDLSAGVLWPGFALRLGRPSELTVFTLRAEPRSRRD